MEYDKHPYIPKSIHICMYLIINTGIAVFDSGVLAFNLIYSILMLLYLIIQIRLTQ